MLDGELLKSYYDDEAEKVFKPLRTFLAKQGVPAKFVHKVGHAAEVIGKTAEAGGFDLLMLGSHGHGALANLVMGSVATKVLAGCKVPTLLVR
jgi:nucleotide-binding universal stress UspA family protein